MTIADNWFARNCHSLGKIRPEIQRNLRNPPRNPIKKRLFREKMKGFTKMAAHVLL
jgi:hypothetical protein